MDGRTNERNDGKIGGANREMLLFFLILGFGFEISIWAHTRDIDKSEVYITTTLYLVVIVVVA